MVYENPPLIEAPKNENTEFERQNMNEELARPLVILTDEKNQLGWPRWHHSYWHNLRTAKRIKISRHFGGGSVMVCDGTVVRNNITPNKFMRLPIYASHKFTKSNLDR